VFPAKTKKGVKVVQCDLNGMEIKIWNSISEASKELKINHSNISKVCRGGQKTVGGFILKQFLTKFGKLLS
jgi:hypothetical protein